MGAIDELLVMKKSTLMTRDMLKWKAVNAKTTQHDVELQTAIGSTRTSDGKQRAALSRLESSVENYNGLGTNF